MINIKRIIAFVLLILIIIYKLIINKKVDKKKTYVARKENSISVSLFVCGLMIFIISLLMCIYKNGGDISLADAIKYIVNSLSIALIVVPINISSLYRTMFTDEERYCNIKTIITDKIDDKMLEKFNIANINVIVINNLNNKKLKLKSLEENEISKNVLHKSIIIHSDNIKILDKMIDKDITLYETKDLNKLYEKIIEARGKYDSYMRIIKYLISTYLPLILSYFLLLISGFPFVYDILLIVLLKISTLLVINGVYKYLPYDNDVVSRHSKGKKMFMGSQELIFSIAQGFINLFAITIPYMLVLSEGGDIKLAFSLYVEIFIFANLFYTYSTINDSFFVKILYKNITNWRLIIYSICLIIITILLNYILIFNTLNIELRNYIACIGFGAATIALNEFVKLARYFGKKGSKKNELKNN